MPWPLSQDYNEAIQNPAQCFADPELQQGEAVTDALGLPVPCSGNLADVYAVQHGQCKWAVKCFTRQIPGLKERYAEISKYLQQAQLPFMVEFQFLEQGIRVQGQWYPVLKMQWVEGQTLNTFVRNQVDSPQNLNTLCQIWVKLAARLREANLAHCDLQHGNVLLVPGSQAGILSVRLVDYDGMCVPALELLKTMEVGHPAYQHPQRLREGTYGLEIDRFSHLVIYTALRGVIVGGRGLWNKYDNSDNLLFTQQDFEAPNKSRLFAQLLRFEDPVLGSLVRALIDAARKPVDQTPLLESLLPAQPRTQVKAAPAATRSSAANDVWAQVADGRQAVVKDFRRKRRSLAVPMIVAAVVLFASGFAGVYWLMKKPVAATDLATSSELAGVQPSSMAPLSQSSHTTVEPSSSQRQPTSGPESKLELKSEPKTESKPEPKTEPKAEPRTEQKPEPKIEPRPAKSAIPDAESQTRAEKLIKDIFKEDYALNKPEDVLALANKLLKQAPETKDDAVARYCLFAEGARLAATVGAWDAAFKAIDDLAKEYEVNVVQMKLVTLEYGAPFAKTPDSNKALMDAIMPLTDQALSSDDYVLAGRLLKVAEEGAKKTQKVSLVSQVQARLKEIESLKGDFEAFKQARATLAQEPKDAAANLTVGKHLCFLKGDWDKGLVHLELGSDPKLKALAKKDRAGAESALAKVEIGDAWWDLAEGERPVKLQVQRRACHWYRMAELGLTGLTLVKVEKRLELMAKQSPEGDTAVSVNDANQFKGHTEKVTSVLFMKGGQSFISGSEDKTVRLWEAKTGREIGQFKGAEAPLTALALSPDYSRLCAVGVHTMGLWEVDSKRSIFQGRQTDNNNPMTSLAFTSQDGSRFACGHSTGRLQMYTLAASALSWKVVGEAKVPVNCLVCAKDGRTAAAAGGDGVVRLFDFEKGEELRQFPGHAGAVLAVAISSDGQAIVSAGADKTIRVWNATTGQMTRLIKGHSGPVTSVAIFPEAGRILSGSEDKTVRLWDARTGREIRALKGHTEAVTCVAVSPNNKMAISGSADRTVRLWDLTK